MKNEKPIPSPFWNNNHNNINFQLELEKLRQKYGYNQIFVAFATASGVETSQWTAFSNVMSEAMCEILRGAAEDMQEVIEEQKNNG